MARLPDAPSRLFRTPAPIHGLLSPPALALPFGLPFDFTPYSSFIFTCPCFSRTHSSFRSVYHAYSLRLTFPAPPLDSALQAVPLCSICASLLCRCKRFLPHSSGLCAAVRTFAVFPLCSSDIRLFLIVSKSLIHDRATVVYIDPLL